MLAGVARIVEVSFIVPKYTSLPEAASTDDNHSEHTLTEPGSTSNSGLMQSVMAFRHLPPFVRGLQLTKCDGHLRSFESSSSCLPLLGKVSSAEMAFSQR